MLHNRIDLTCIFVVLLVASTVTGIGAAGPPPIGDERNGLTAAEVATLFSRDPDSGDAISLARARESSTAIQDLANGTDITFKRPPSTAATWSRTDFSDLTAGDVHTSRYPPHAEDRLKRSRFLREAHASVFWVPGTRVHLAPDRTPLVVPAEGSLYSFIDFRVQLPEDTRGKNNRRVTWSISDTEIKQIQLTRDGTVLDSTDQGTHTPQLEFTGIDPGNHTLTVEATISARIQKRIRTKHVERDEDCEGVEDGEEFGDPDDDCEIKTWWSTSYEYFQEELTVTDSLPVTVYQFDPSLRYARYPTGHVEVLVAADRPWSGFTADGTTVTGTYRFFTARDPRWDTLIASSKSGDRRFESDALPVYVHAYPATSGAQIRPIRGPDLLEVSGKQMASPHATLGDNISVDVETEPYNQSQYILIRLPEFGEGPIRVDGIVRGETVTLDSATVPGQVVRRSNLTVEVLRSDETQATLRLRLRDTQTGRPIMLQEPHGAGGESGREGYISVAGRRVETNSSGVALVTVEEPGSYTARYHPESWVSVVPAYTGDTARVRWHPLGTLAGWVALFVHVLLAAIPFALAYYAGTRLPVLLGRRDTP